MVPDGSVDVLSVAASAAVPLAPVGLTVMFPLPKAPVPDAVRAPWFTVTPPVNVLMPLVYGVRLSEFVPIFTIANVPPPVPSMMAPEKPVVGWVPASDEPMVSVAFTAPLFSMVKILVALTVTPSEREAICWLNPFRIQMGRLLANGPMTFVLVGSTLLAAMVTVPLC